MKFSDLYKNNQFRYSIEIFPPKTPAGVAALFHELKELGRVKPAYVSVTYGALGSTRDLTQDLAIRVHRELGYQTAFHFTCVGSGRDEIKSYVNKLYEAGINFIVALRGDQPQGLENYQPPADGFRYANELVAYLKSVGNFSLAVAGYPEKHGEALDFKTDINNLKRKVDAGADVIITQLFFDNADYYSWLEKVRAVGIQIPIIAGILPIQSLKQIQRITGLCGAQLPPDLVRRLENCHDDDAAMRVVGIEHALKQCADLKKNGVVGIHFYALNKAYSVLKIVDGLGEAWI